MRTKEQHEREKLLVNEIKKLEQRIKKEEKEEKNFRKLIYDEQSFAIPPQVSNVNMTESPDQLAQDEGGKGGRKDRGSGVFLRSQVLQRTLPTKKEMLQRKFDTVLESMNLEPLDLQPTQKVADLYQELVNEVLKMFALENYTKKLQDELNVIKEAKEEKLAFLEPAKEQISQFI